MKTLTGYLRDDGRKGIRNYLLIAYTVECAHHVAREIAWSARHQGVQLIGFGGCAPNAYADRMMKILCTHPNVGGVLLVSLGCENMDKAGIADAVRASGRPVYTLEIQEQGGTESSIRQGRRWIKEILVSLKQAKRVPMAVHELAVGTICGGSDATSGITANPAMGRAFDMLLAQQGTAIFEETGELVGCEQLMAQRAVTPALGKELIAVVEKAKHYYTAMGYASFSAGNADGGLTTIEEKSLGAYCKSGNMSISGILKPGDRPPKGGLYLLDIVPDGPPKFGWPNINDNAEIAELGACGCHLVLFSTGRGSVVGAAITPVIKVCANPETFSRMRGDMDIDAGQILLGEATINDIAEQIYTKMLETAVGEATLSEQLGHQEFVLTYKQFYSSAKDGMFGKCIK